MVQPSSIARRCFSPAVTHHKCLHALCVLLKVSPRQVLQQPHCSQAAVYTAWESYCAFYPQLLPSSGMQFPTCLVALGFNPDGRKSLGLGVF